MRLVLLSVAVLLSLLSAAQSPVIDSIKNLLSVQPLRGQIGSLNELAWYYRNIDPDSSRYFANRAINLASNEADPHLMAISVNSLGSAYQATGQYDSAVIYLNQALSSHQELKDSTRIATTLNNIGICQDELGNYKMALTYYFDALKIAEALNDVNTEAMLVGNIGIVYKKMKSYSKVLEYYKRALGLYEQLGNDFGVAVTTGNVGSVYIQLKEFDKAIEYSHSAETLYKDLGYVRYIPYVIGNAAIASDSLNLAETEKLYLESIRGHEDFDNQYELAYQYKNIASFYLKKSDFSRSSQFVTLAIETAQAIDAKEMLKDALRIAATVSFGNGDFRQAYLHQLAYETVKDSIFETNKTKQIFELQTQYETEKKEQQITLQAAQISKQAIQNQRNIAIIVGLILGISLLVGIFLLNRNRLLKKQRLLLQEAQIQLKEAQIEAAISSQEKERSRFAKDLHDGFGQMISILNLNLKSLEDNGKDKHEVFENSSKILEDMYQELKGICFNLMPQTLVKHGIVAALNEFAARINAADKMRVETDFFGLDHRLTEVQEISLYRISQEWVNNVIKYSDTTKVTIQITRDEEEMTLMIEDDGTGFDLNLLKSGKGNGWKNMNSRANLINGELEIDTTPGIKGSTLIVNVPVSVEEIVPA